MASFAGGLKGGGDDLPPTRFMIRTRDGMRCYTGPPSITPEVGAVTTSEDSGHGLQGVNGLRMPPLFSPDGSLVCIVHERMIPISIHNGDTGALLGEIDVIDATFLEFSPLGNYLTVWSRSKPNDGQTREDNLKIFSVASKEVIASFYSKTLKKDALQWSGDETYCFQVVTNQVRVLRCDGTSLKQVGKVMHQNVSQYKVPSNASDTSMIPVAVFEPEHKGKPGKCCLYYVNTTLESGKGDKGDEEDEVTVEGPVSTRTIMAASEATLLWNTPGTSLLVHTQSDVDRSGTSYYGATGLCVMTTKMLTGKPGSEMTERITQSKEGPVYDVKWNPKGDRFIVAAGNMPSRSTMYNEKAEACYEFGEAHRNTILFAPHSRFVCIAGFGNLAGEMDFYDTYKLKKLGVAIAHCSVAYGWSPDSRYFMTATLAPRMNVDNNYKIFKYNGVGPIAQEGFTQAFDAFWQPKTAVIYPERGSSPRREGDAVPVKDIKVAAPVAAYRPPGSRGLSTGFADKLKRDSAPVGKVKDGAMGGKVPGGGLNTNNNQITGGMRFAPRNIPGMPTGGGKNIPGMPSGSKKGPVLTEEQKAAKKEADKKKKEEKKKREEEEAAKKAAEEAAAAAKSVPLSELSEEEKAKKLKGLKKKLKAIEELKASGKELNEDQKAKLASEADILSQISQLSI